MGIYLILNVSGQTDRLLARVTGLRVKLSASDWQVGGNFEHCVGGSYNDCIHYVFFPFFHFLLYSLQQNGSRYHFYVFCICFRIKGST